MFSRGCGKAPCPNVLRDIFPLPRRLAPTTELIPASADVIPPMAGPSAASIFTTEAQALWTVAAAPS